MTTKCIFHDVRQVLTVLGKSKLRLGAVTWQSVVGDQDANTDNTHCYAPGAYSTPPHKPATTHPTTHRLCTVRHLIIRDIIFRLKSLDV